MALAVELYIQKQMARAVALAGLALLAWSITSGDARADSSDSIIAAYEVTIGGLTALRVTYDAELSGAGYRSRASVETRGLAALFSDYRMDMTASGAIVKGKVKPAQFASVAGKKSKTEFLALNWSAAGLLRQNSPASKDPRTQAEIIAAVTAGTADPLASIMRLGGSSAEKPCQMTQRVFNGQDVFDLRFTFEEDAVITSDFQGVYRGPVYKCHMTYVPVAGRLATEFRKSKGDPPTFTVWLAAVRSPALGSPVQISALPKR